MIAELQPVWKQLQETYAAIRESLAAVPEEKLHWCPGEGCSTIAQMVRHIARANLIYCHVIERTERNLALVEQPLSRETLHTMLDGSERRTHDVFDALTQEDAHVPRADDWQPLGPLVEGPLDAVWFAQQIVRHSAYHLGQLNYVMWLGGFGVDYE